MHLSLDMPSRVQLQASADLIDILNLLGDADDSLNVPAWEELNHQNKQYGASPENVEEGNTYQLPWWAAPGALTTLAIPECREGPHSQPASFQHPA